MQEAMVYEKMAGNCVRCYPRALICDCRLQEKRLPRARESRVYSLQADLRQYYVDLLDREIF
jgi:hypothetical protein